MILQAGARCRRAYTVASQFLLVLLLACGLYGSRGPFVAGHYGYHAGEYATRARHTLRHHTVLPSNMPGYNEPTPDTYYLHHPILTHQIVTVSLLLFGPQELAIRAAALFSTVLAFWLILAIVRRYYGLWQSVFAAAVFVLVPIHIWFGAHIDPGMPGIACVLGFLFCYLRWVETAHLRWGLTAIALFVLSALFEWSPYLAGFPVGLHALYLAARRRGRFLLWPALFLLSAALPLLLHYAIVVKTGHLAEMRLSYLSRSGGPGFRAVLPRLWTAARLLFGDPLLLLMLSWPVLLLRRQRSARALLPIALATAWVGYMVLLPVGVQIHLYRLMYGGVLSALAAAEWADAAFAAAERWLSFWKLRWLVPVAFCLGIIGSTAPLAWGALLESRRLGGQPLYAGYDPELRPRAFIQRVLSLTTPAVLVYVHDNFMVRKDLFYYLDRKLMNAPSLSWALSRPQVERDQAVFVLIEAGLSTQERDQLSSVAKRHPIWRVPPYALVDLRPSQRVDEPGTATSHIETLLPQPARSAWRRYWEGPYAHPQLGPASR